MSNLCVRGALEDMLANLKQGSGLIAERADKHAYVIGYIGVSEPEGIYMAIIHAIGRLPQPHRKVILGIYGGAGYPDTLTERRAALKEKLDKKTTHKMLKELEEQATEMLITLLLKNGRGT